MYFGYLHLRYNLYKIKPLKLATLIWNLSLYVKDYVLMHHIAHHIFLHQWQFFYNPKNLLFS